MSEEMEDDDVVPTPVLGVDIADLPEGSVAAGVVVIAKVNIEDLRSQYLSFRLGGDMPLWQAEQACRDALQWILEMREATGT